jgi:hypothetical protein
MAWRGSPPSSAAPAALNAISKGKIAILRQDGLMHE